MIDLPIWGIILLALLLAIVVWSIIDSLAEKKVTKRLQTLRKNDEREQQQYLKTLEEDNNAWQRKFLADIEQKRRESEDYALKIRNEAESYCYQKKTQIDRGFADANDYTEKQKREADLYCHVKKRQVDQYADILEEIKQKISGNSFSTKWIASQYEKLMERTIAFIYSLTNYRSETTAEVLTSQKRLRREAERKARFYESILSYYENLFPWLQEYRDENDDLVVDQKAKPDEDQQFVDDDESSYWVPKEEWLRLPSAERNQLALDRYIQSRNKSPHEIGRDYESFIGYGYETQGYEVHYHGMIKGLEDLGRDLICKKSNEILIIQCKCWSRNKVIREKHINQLFGTMVEYAIRNKCVLDGYLGKLQSLEDLTKPKVKGVFATSTLLSEEANNFADLLGIKVIQGVPLGPYPRIKCNVNPNRRTKIYHLPFDQQYEHIAINKSEGDFYTFTALDAEKKGFVRAKRHYSE